MASGQRYVQWLKSKRCWRFRRRVPGHLRELIGKTEWIEILPARDRTEAERLAIPYIDETNRITLCCTDQQPGAVSPPQRHLWEANVLRPPEFEHAVQRGDSNGHLGHLPASGP
jgi:hypothetical protein